jgi:hypothetical protein
MSGVADEASVYLDIAWRACAAAAEARRLRAALSDAAAGLWKAAALVEPGYRVPPSCLYRLLAEHAETARAALEEGSDVI